MEDFGSAKLYEAQTLGGENLILSTVTTESKGLYPVVANHPYGWSSGGESDIGNTTCQVEGEGTSTTPPCQLEVVTEEPVSTNKKNCLWKSLLGLLIVSALVGFAVWYFVLDHGKKDLETQKVSVESLLEDAENEAETLRLIYADDRRHELDPKVMLEVCDVVYVQEEVFDEDCDREHGDRREDQNREQDDENHEHHENDSRENHENDSRENHENDGREHHENDSREHLENDIREHPDENREHHENDSREHQDENREQHDERREDHANEQESRYINRARGHVCGSDEVVEFVISEEGVSGSWRVDGVEYNMEALDREYSRVSYPEGRHRHPEHENRDSQDPDSEEHAGPYRDSEEHDGPHRDSEEHAGPHRDSEEHAGPHRDSEEHAEPHRDSEEHAEPHRDSEESGRHGQEDGSFRRKL